MSKLLKAATCHTSPIFLSATQTTQKTISLITQAAKNSANLVVFPESHIPAFPIWSSLRPPSQNHNFFSRMVQESLYIDGSEITSVRSVAKTLGVCVSLGFSEKARYSSATLWNSNILISSEGKILLHHRKLMPTFFEKLTWAAGDAHGLRVAETAWGKVGALICGENTNSLAKYALLAQGEEVHISTWPAVWPTRSLAAVDGSKMEGRNYDNVMANRIRAAAHCFEAKCFGILCSGFLNQEIIDTVVAGSDDEVGVRKTLEASGRGASMFLDPTGEVVTGHVVDEKGERQERDYLQHEEGILYADLDMALCVEGKQYHDLAGGYQRFDVFDLKVDRTRREPVRFRERSRDGLDGFDGEEGERE